MISAGNLVVDGAQPFELHCLTGIDGLEVRALGKIKERFLSPLKTLFDTPEGVDEEKDHEKRGADGAHDLNSIHKRPLLRRNQTKIKEPVHAA